MMGADPSGPTANISLWGKQVGVSSCCASLSSPPPVCVTLQTMPNKICARHPSSVSLQKEWRRTSARETRKRVKLLTNKREERTIGSARCCLVSTQNNTPLALWRGGGQGGGGGKGELKRGGGSGLALH